MTAVDERVDLSALPSLDGDVACESTRVQCPDAAAYEVRAACGCAANLCACHKELAREHVVALIAWGMSGRCPKCDLLTDPRQFTWRPL